MNLIRTEDGGKFSTPIVHYNRNYALYYNETISYQPDETYDIEQSIAAGYLAYQLGGGSLAEVQDVVWASGAWSESPGYVQNLYNYTGTTIFWK